MVYEHNLNCLKEKHPQIYNVIIKSDFEWSKEQAFVCDAKNGEQIVVYRQGSRDIYLNSKYNPRIEAEKYLSDIEDMSEKATLTMFGMASGVFAKVALEKTCKEVKIIIYEPCASIFMQVIKNIDITDILDNDRIILSVEGINSQGYDVAIGNNIHSYNKTTSRHISLPKYVGIFSDSYKIYAEKTQAAYDRLAMQTYTFLSVGKEICENNIMNLRYLPGCRSGEDYINHFPDDMPAIVVSAGPSLAKNIHLLREAKGKALIMVVDTAISHVLAMGVEPDMVITVDFAKYLHYFEDQRLKEVGFVVEPDSHYRVLDKVKPNNVIFCGTDVALWTNLMKSQGSDLKFLDVGGSVATAAIATVMKWGFKKVILIGQDLAFSDGSMHIGEESREYDFSTGEYTYVKGINGEQLVTYTNFMPYLKWIEKVAYLNQNVEIIDATEGGAYKEHTTIMTFREAIDSYCTNSYDVKELLDSVPRLFTLNGKNIIIDTLDNMKNNLRRMRRIFLEGASASHRGGIMLSRGDYNVKELKKINSIMQKADETLLEAQERELLSKIDSGADNAFEEDLYEMEADDIKESIRMYKKCEKYYTALAEGCVNITADIEHCLNAM